MKVLATFDGTPHSESILPLLGKIAALPDAEIVLLRIQHEPSGKQAGGPRMQYASSGQIVHVQVEIPQTPYAETQDQALTRVLEESQDYLRGIARKLPEGAKVFTQAHIANHAARAIIREAEQDQPDVIVMAMRSRGGLAKAVFGSVTEEVIASGVAPVLVVHPPEETARS